MTMKECLDNLGKGQVEAGYVFYGEEEYLKEQALEQIKRVLLAPGMEMMDSQVIEGQEMTLEEYRRLTSMPPFMSARRLVVVRDDPRFLSGTRPDKEDKAAALAEHLGEMCTLVFYVRGNPDEAKKWLDAMNGPLTVVNFAPTDTREGAKWIRRMARLADVKLLDGTAEYLFEYVGGLLQPAWAEMGKLAAYCQGEAIDRAAVEAVCVQAVEHKVFALLDDLMAGRGDRAMAAYRSLMQDGEEPMRFLNLLVWQVRAAARAGEIVRSGMSSGQAARVLNVKPFAVEKALRRRDRDSRWSEVLLWCAEADMAFKGGRMKEDTSVDYLVMRLMHLMAG